MHTSQRHNSIGHFAVAACIVGLLTGLHTVAAPPEGKESVPKEPAKAAKVEVRPEVVPLWKRTTVGLPAEDDINAEQHKPVIEWLNSNYRDAVAEAQRSVRPLIPPAVPVADGGCVFYANDQSIVYRCLTPGFEAGEFRKAGDLLWHTDRDFGLFWMARDLGPRKVVEEWRAQKPPGHPSDRWFHRTLAHSLSITGDNVDYVDEIGFLPVELKPVDPRMERQVRGHFTDAIHGNFLRVIDTISGKLVDKLGSDWVPEGKNPASYLLGLPQVRGEVRYLIRERVGHVWL